MKIIAILHRSAGNSEVGDMWKETAVFDDNTTLGNVINWANVKVNSCDPDMPLRNTLELSVPEPQ